MVLTNNSQVWAKGYELSELYIFYVGRYDSNWVIQQKTENNLSPFFWPEVLMEMSAHMWRGTVLRLIKVNVSAYLTNATVEVTPTLGLCCVLICWMLGTPFLSTVIIFCVDGFLHSKRESSVLAYASHLQLSTNLPMIFTSKTIHIQPFHPINI